MRGIIGLEAAITVDHKELQQLVHWVVHQLQQLVHQLMKHAGLYTTQVTYCHNLKN